MYTLLNNETISQLEMEGVLIGTAVKLYDLITQPQPREATIKEKEYI